MRRPTPSASRNAASVIASSVGEQLAAAVVERGRHGVAVADAPDAALRPRGTPPARLSSTFAISSCASCASSSAAASARSPSAAVAPGQVRLRAAALDLEQVRGRAAPTARPAAARRAARPGSSGLDAARAASRARTLGAQLVEPGVREVVVAGRAHRRRVPARARRGRAARAPAASVAVTGSCTSARDDLLRRRRARAPPAARVEAARRRGVEHDAAADGRVGAQDDAVAARRDDRLARAEAARTSPSRTTRAGTRVRADVHRHARRGSPRARSSAMSSRYETG